MARPKSENPRSEIVKLRVTVGEKARIEAAAAAGGQAVADYVRGRVLEVRPAAGLLEPTTVTATTVVPVREERGATVRELRNVPEPAVLHRCPKFAGCGFQAPSAKARCPIHGCTVKS